MVTRMRKQLSAEERKAQTARATETVQNYWAERAIDDPAKLARAARIVRLALERGLLAVDDVAPASSEVTT
jgi:hypothetical protein